VNGNEEIIEVEVVEIDGIAMEPRPDHRERKNAGGQFYGSWQSRVKRLDARWWPLWLVLGFFVLVVFFTVGIFVAVVFIAWRMFVWLYNGIASMLNPRRRAND
jgi:hypothetical protein